MESRLWWSTGQKKWKNPMTTLTVPIDDRPRILDQPAHLLTLFDMARSRQLDIDPTLLDDIHRHAETLPSTLPL